MKKTIHLIAAARPNFMKIAPLFHALKTTDWADPLIVHNKHYDLNMSDAFFRDLMLPEPDFHLGVGSGTHAEQTGKVMIVYEKLLMDRTGAVKIPPHVINRLCRLTMGVSFKDFEQWSQRNGINPILLAWLKKFTEFLYKYDPEKNHHCTPRSLAFVSNVLNNPTGDPVLDQARIEGFIGEGPATELLSFTTYLSRMPDPDEAYAHPDTCRVPDDSEPDVQYAMQQSMIWRANAKNIGALRKYMKRLPKDLEVATLLALFEKDVKFRNHTEVAAWSAENSKLVLNTMMNK